ncbi:MAG: hypothetical protein R3B70_39850 [Polyangiaceae bacterium]
MRAFAVVCGAMFCLSGCVEAFGDKNPYEPGEALGTFHVTAQQTANDCGEGALGAPVAWDFDVKLAWEERSLFWDSGGQIIVGSLSEDRSSFEISTVVVQDMRTASDGGLPPCSMERTDVAKGTLTAEGEGVSAAQGTLSYSFQPTAGSMCADLVDGEEPLFASLPCEIKYAFKAPRTGD